MIHEPADDFRSEIMTAWNRGFEAGAKQQNELDTQLMLKWLGKLEEIPGIGPKMAARIGEHWLKFINDARK